jgi:hypothetical protein
LALCAPPVVPGKLVEFVVPVTIILPDESIADAELELSAPFPPRYVD